MSSDAILAETKCIITGLLTSNPTKPTIRQLCNDFINTVGYQMPFKPLGFTNPEEFLRSLTDTVIVHGSGPLASIEVIIKPKSAHINELVTKQRFSGKCKNTAPRRRRPALRPHHTNVANIPPLIPPQYTNVDQNRRSYGRPPECNNADRSFFPPESNNIERNRSASLQLEVNNVDGNKSAYLSGWNNVDRSRGTSCQSESTQTEFMVETQVESLSMQLSQSKLSDVVEIDEYKSKVSREVQNNLRKLILQHPKGIYCSKLPNEYRKVYGRGLHYERFNFRSLIEMISDLPEIFHYIQISSNDFLLFSKNVPLPKIEVPKKAISVSTDHEVEEKDFLKQIPKSELAPYLIPSDVVTICDKIPNRFSTLKTEIGDYHDVTVAEIYDLSKFYVYCTEDGLNHLMIDLQDFFKQNRNKYVIPEVLLDVGLYCVALYFGEYHRAIIVNLMPGLPNLVRVLFVDYGTVANVPINEIWYLPKTFAKLETQAIRTRLSNIYPTKKNITWTIEAIQRFRELIDKRVLVAEVVDINKEEKILEVYLADITNENDIFYINDILVKEGFALYIDQEQSDVKTDPNCVPNVDYLHLFPEFYEIETGYAYSNVDLAYASENKIPLHHHMPQYFDIIFDEKFSEIEAQMEEYCDPQMMLRVTLKQQKRIFDFSMFPPKMRSAIYNVTKRTAFKVPCEVNYDPGAVEKSELIKSECSNLNNANLSDLIDGLTLKTIKDENQRDTLKKLNLNQSDSRVVNDLTKTVKSTNPFLNGDLLKYEISTNSTNPFLNVTDDDTSCNVVPNEFIQIFSKTSENAVIKSNDPNTVAECSCKKEKQVSVTPTPQICEVTPQIDSGVNIAEGSGISSINSSDLSPTETGLEVVPKVKTPPGFSSKTRRDRSTWEVAYGSSQDNQFFPGNNPYYARFMMELTNRFVQPQFIPHQYTRSFAYPNYTPGMGPRPFFNTEVPQFPNQTNFPFNFIPPQFPFDQGFFQNRNFN